MKNLHLIPPSVIDIAEKYSSPIAQQNEKMNYILRLEATRNFCDEIIKKHNDQNMIFAKKKVNR
jgi:hypothetical protein